MTVAEMLENHRWWRWRSNYIKHLSESTSIPVLGAVHLTKIMFGALITVCVIDDNSDIKKFFVDSGVRDIVVMHLNAW